MPTPTETSTLPPIVEPSGEGSNSSDTHHSEPIQTQQQQKQEEIAKTETAAVWYMRLVLLVALACSAIVVSLAVFFYLSADEEDDFHTQFRSDANKILEGIGSSFDDTLGAMDSYISRMVAQQRPLNTSFPFVSVPGFGVAASKLLRLSKAYSIGTAYFVSPEQKADWEAYARQHNDWIEDVIQVQDNNEEWKGPTLRNYQPLDEIWQVDETGIFPAKHTLNEMNNYLASWQAAPLIEGIYSIPYGIDVWTSEASPDIMECITSQRVVIAKSPNVLSDPDNEEHATYIKELAEQNELSLPEGEDGSEPLTGISYPIIDSMDSVRIDVNQDQSVVGILFFSIYWRELIRKILPDQSIGLVVVFEASCGDLFTYQLDGPASTYLGAGDLHDTKYDHLEVKASFTEIMETAESEHGSSYTGIPLNQEYCSRTVRIYPSQATEDQHTTKNPMLLSILTALIFVFTSIVFFFYDWLVARRQRIVNNRAVASSAIVSSLFPEQVAKQLYQEREEQRQDDDNLKSFMSGSSDAAKSSKPIASLYHSTTILFADLAGFTKWSSQRSPEDVFTMLETLYGAFDMIAKKYGVFKVETIGDCYVCVTGIPESRKDHATSMCRFAWECMAKMNELKVELAESLGEETLNLQFRVGMHSGSVTAGVLRGEKGRFQLFGDTMNTASRMESTGVPGRIHVSQATADELVARKKSHWLTPREDKVHAKGKGVLQTYFVAFSGAKSSTTVSSKMSNLHSFSSEENDDNADAMSDDADNHKEGDDGAILASHIDDLEKKLGERLNKNVADPRVEV